MLFALLIACGEPPVVLTDAPVPAAPMPAAVPEAGVRLDLPTEDGQTRTAQLDGLQVVVTAHRPRGVPVWTFLTDGLFGEQLALTVRRDRTVDIEPVLQYLQSIHDGGIENAPRLWEAAGMAPEGPGFLGRKTYFALYFAAPHPFAGVPGTDAAITAVLLRPEETEWAFKVGPQRILARLAKQGGVFPTLPWADPDRPSVVEPTAEATDPLLDLKTGLQTSLQVTLVDDARLEIGVDPVSLRRMRKSGVLDLPAFKLFAGRAPDVDGLIVSQPNVERAIVTAGEAPTRVGLNGLVIRESADVDEVTVAGDLAELKLTTPSREALWTALVAGTPTALDFGGMPVHVVAPGWTKLLPPTPAPIEPTGPQVEGVELTMSPVDLAARIPEEDLKTAVGLIEIDLIDHATTNPAPAERMFIEVLYRPDGTARYQPQWEVQPANTTWWDALHARLETLDVPPVKGDVNFRMQVSFK